MRAAAGLVLVATLGLVLGCGTTRGQTSVPALLVSPSVEARGELGRVVSEALHVPVRLADDALVHDSVLVVDRSMPRDAAGIPLDGRVLGKPEHFRLVMQGSRCVVIQERTGKSWTLVSATCKPAPAG
ncbi:MAG TPA: hypothetical protein VIE42_14785 [Steroidobacteraceae bacterium]|jgi:hypothetical protein